MPTIILSLLVTARQWRSEREGREIGGREGGDEHIDRMYVFKNTILSLFRKQRGRLKLCSESLLFDPIDIEHPIIKVNDYY